LSQEKLPLELKLLLLTVFTSQIDKVRLRNRERPHAVVEFGPEDYAPLDRPTAVDGNVILRRSLSEMVDLVRNVERAKRTAGAAHWPASTACPAGSRGKFLRETRQTKPMVGNLRLSTISLGALSQFSRTVA